MIGILTRKWKSSLKRKSVELFIKNIKNVFENFGKYAVVIKNNMKDNESTTRFDFYALVNLFKETKEIFLLLNKKTLFENLFYEKFFEYLANGLIKNINAKNLYHKMLEFYCFFSTYNYFKNELFEGILDDLLLLRVDAKFIEKVEVGLQDQNRPDGS